MLNSKEQLLKEQFRTNKRNVEFTEQRGERVVAEVMKDNSNKLNY